MLGPEIKFVEDNYVLYQGRKLLYLAGIDYHSLSRHPEILKAAADAALEYGLGATGSRCTTGNHVLYRELEKVLAEFFDTEAAITLPSGYLSNQVILQAVGDEFDMLFIDEKAHSSVVDPARQTGKPIVYFNHLDAQHLEDQLKKQIAGKEKPLVLTDGVFSPRGEIAPLNAYGEVLSRYGGKMLVDDAHGMAVVGRTGKGAIEEQGVDHELVYFSGTLGKGFGTAGGAIVSNGALVDKIIAKSRAFTGCTGLALPVAAAAARSVRYLQEHNHLISALQDRALALKAKFKSIGLDLPPTPCPIFSIAFHDAEKNQRLRGILLENGIYPSFINYPGSPEGGHFRFIITDITTSEQEALLFNSVRSCQ